MGEEKKDFSKLIAAGDYEATAKYYKEKKNSKGTGRNASILYVIQEGEFKDYGVFYNANNIVHPSEQAQEIAEKKVNSALEAAGVKDGLEGIERMEIEELIKDKPVVITVAIADPVTYTTPEGEERTTKKKNVVTAVNPL